VSGALRSLHDGQRHPGADETRFALIERREVWSLAARVLGEARTGSGSVLLIEGASGLGKTALLATIKTLALESGMQVLSAHGRRREREFRYGVAMQLLEAGLRDARGGSARLWPSRGAPLVAQSEGAAGFEDVHAMYRMCMGVARAAPLLLLVDDADLADEPSIAALLYLTERIADAPLAIVLSAWPAEGGRPALLRDIARHQVTTRCTLQPLTFAGTERRLSKRWPGMAIDEVAAEIFRASRGNPFVVDALAAVVAERDRAGLPLEELAPATLAEWTMTRAADVDARAPELLSALAVLGQGSEPRHASELARIDGDAAGRLVDRLVDVDILERGDGISFAQPAVAAAIQRSQPAGERAAISLRAALLLASDDAPPERVASHLLQAARAGSGWTVDLLCDAAAVALSRGAPAEAVLYLKRALEEPPPRDKRAHVVLELGRAEAAAGDPDADVHLRAAVHESDQALAEPLEALEAGRALVALGNPCDAIEAFQRGLSAAGDTDSDLAAWLRASQATALWLTKLSDAESSPLPPVPEMAVTPGDRSLLALHAFAGTIRGAPATDVRALAERALGRGALLEDETSAGLSYYLATFALAFAESLQTAEAALTAAIQDAQSRGSVLGFAIASRLRARAILMRGRLSDAAVDARHALAIEAGDWKLGRGAARTILSAVLLERGDLVRARQYLDEADAAAGPVGVQQLWLLSARGRLELYGGDAAAALQSFLRCGEIAEAARVTNPAVVEWRALAGQATVATGDLTEGERLIHTDLSQAEAFGAPGPVGRAMRALASVSDAAAALEILEAAVDVLRKSEAALERAGAMVDFGAALRRSGKRRDAVRVLREGLDLAQRCGAEALVCRAMDEASAAGARPRRTALTGLEALTERERQVASLAAQGYSNREIAERRFVTVKTVEWHLSHAYMKLGVNSRGELSAKLNLRVGVRPKP
jgi:DNA-binding CsgD family transcriptional regulator